MKLNLSKLRVPVMVVLVVTAMVGAPLFLPDSVETQVSPVGESEAIAPVVAIPIGVAAVGTGLYGVGYYQGITNDDFEPSGMSDQQFRNSVKARANANLIDQRKIIETEIQDLDQSTYDRALSEANIEFVSSIEEGKNKSVAVSKAKSAARDVIASEQILALEQWETQMIDVYLINSDVTIRQSNVKKSDTVTKSIDTPSGSVEYDAVTKSVSALPSGPTAGVDGDENIGMRYYKYNVFQSFVIGTDYYEGDERITKSINLVNGSTHQIYTIKGENGNKLNPFDPTVPMTDDGINDIPSSIDVYGEQMIDLSESDYSWDALGDYYDETESRVITNLGTADDPDGYLSQVYDSWESGTIESEDILTPYDYSRMSMDTGSVGSQSWANVQLATKGINANLSTSVVVETSDGSVIAGDLFTRSTPSNGSWTVGETYNTNDYEHPFFMTTTVQKDNETTGQIVKINGEFTVSEAYGSNGENVSSITPRDYTVSTTDTSELEDKINNLIEKNQELEEEMEQRSAISVGGGGDGINPTLILIILVVLGGGALAVSQQPPPRNRRRY